MLWKSERGTGQVRRLLQSLAVWLEGFLGFRFASPQAILKRSFAAEGAGTNALEKRKRDRSSSKVPSELGRVVGGFLGFRFALPQAIWKRSFAAEGAGTNALEKRKRDRSSSKAPSELGRVVGRIPGVPLCFTPGYLEAQLCC